MGRNRGIVLILAGVGISIICLMFSTSILPDAGMFKALPYLEIVFHFGEPNCSGYGCSYPDKVYIRTKYVLSLAVVMILVGIGAVVLGNTKADRE